MFPAGIQRGKRECGEWERARPGLSPHSRRPEPSISDRMRIRSPARVDGV